MCPTTQYSTTQHCISLYNRFYSRYIILYFPTTRNSILSLPTTKPCWLPIHKRTPTRIIERERTATNPNGHHHREQPSKAEWKERGLEFVRCCVKERLLSAYFFSPTVASLRRPKSTQSHCSHAAPSGACTRAAKASKQVAHPHTLLCKKRGGGKGMFNTLTNVRGRAPR